MSIHAATVIGANMKNIILVAGVGLLVAFFWGLYQHSEGYKLGQSDLLAEQAIQQAQQLEAQQRQQKQDDEKAAAADETGKTKTEVITRDVIKYIKVPVHTVCNFDNNRVQLKARATENASCIPGFDACAVPTGSAGQ